jgi:hypothetical protein
MICRINLKIKNYLFLIIIKTDHVIFLFSISKDFNYRFAISLTYIIKLHLSVNFCRKNCQGNLFTFAKLYTKNEYRMKLLSLLVNILTIPVIM